MILDAIIQLENEDTLAIVMYKRSVNIEHVPNIRAEPVIFIAGVPRYGLYRNVYHKLNDNTTTWVANFKLPASDITTIGNYLVGNGWTVVSSWHETLP